MQLRPIGITSAFFFASAAVLGACSSGAPNDVASENAAPSEGEAGAEGTSASPIIGGVRATSYTEAALIDMYKGGRLFAACSGSVIAPRVVLTAGHCVDGVDSWRVTAPFAGKQTATSVGGKVYDWKSSGETVDPKLHDIGLVILKDPIQLTSYPTLATSPVANGTKGINVGRIQDGTLSNSALFQGQPVSLRDGASSGFPFDYSSTDIIQSGDSGGPVFLSGTSTHTIIAVNSGAGSGSQVLARTDLLASWIAQQIAANGGGGAGGGSTTGATTGGATTGGSSTTGGTTGGGSCTKVSGNNGSYASPDPITQTTQTFCGNIGPQGDEESWLSFGLSGAGISYNVQVTGNDDAAVGVWKDTGFGYLRIDNDSPQQVRRTSTSGGKYLVAAFSPSATPQTFTLKFSASR